MRRNLLRMWRESSSVKAVNLVKKIYYITEIMNFSQGIVFLLAQPVYAYLFLQSRLRTTLDYTPAPIVYFVKLILSMVGGKPTAGKTVI